MLTDFVDKILLNLNFWGVLGLVGQVVFGARFLVQWIASERKGESTIPLSFWYISIVGSAMTLVYGIGKGELPVIIGQVTGIGVYVRNLVLIQRKAEERAAARATVVAAVPPEAAGGDDAALDLPVAASSARQ